MKNKIESNPERERKKEFLISPSSSSPAAAVEAEAARQTDRHGGVFCAKFGL